MVLYGSIAVAKKTCSELKVCLQRAQDDLHTIPWESSKHLEDFQKTKILEMAKISELSAGTLTTLKRK